MLQHRLQTANEADLSSCLSSLILPTTLTCPVRVFFLLPKPSADSMDGFFCSKQIDDHDQKHAKVDA